MIDISIFNLDIDNCTEQMKAALNGVALLANKSRPEFITPEHLLASISVQPEFAAFMIDQGADLSVFQFELSKYLEEVDTVPHTDTDYTPMLSVQMTVLLKQINQLWDEIRQRGKSKGIDGEDVYAPCPIEITDIVDAMMQLEHSPAHFLLHKYLGNKEDWRDSLAKAYEHDSEAFYRSFKYFKNGIEKRYINKNGDIVSKDGPDIRTEFYIDGKKVDLSANDMFSRLAASAGRLMSALRGMGITQAVISEKPNTSMEQDTGQTGSESTNKGEKEQRRSQREPWEELVTLLNETYHMHNPLVGRKEELDRAIRILCRRDKNNPIFIGEPGVGKTALIYGLVERIEKNDVPVWLQGKQVYSLDMASLVAGTAYHGEFEKRVKAVLDGAKHRGDCILYIDEIHSIMNAGGGQGSTNAADILKPYLEDGSVRFIGTTTYQDYNKSIANNKSIARRFAQIDIKEPSNEETIHIINGLLPRYESHHGVRYTPEAVRYAVEQSGALINDRYQPDKSIDILDEAGALLQQHPLLNKQGLPKAGRFQKVGIQQVKTILTDVCRIDAKALANNSNEELKHLDQRIARLIYGQDEAIRQVVRSVMLSKAGLGEPEKPMASLLFVGPTGVGKTEVCRVLAQELGVQLVRFDMSEYTEKHTVSKLIGSPAGYIGYDEGGLLTDAIRKTPNCVLLLDEVEKAHPDIYNILLQVMDYGKLTDNKGNKADFRNVILIMTSNAGAQFAGQAAVGFRGGRSRGQAMLDTVKKTFRPEFLNRLSATVVFRDMDQHMAALILDKKLAQLAGRLASKNVTMRISDAARQFLLHKGFTPQYGAREMDRAIQQHLTPLLMDSLLFGRLQKGGEAAIDMEGEGLSLK